MAHCWRKTTLLSVPITAAWAPPRSPSAEIIHLRPSRAISKPSSASALSRLASSATTRAPRCWPPWPCNHHLGSPRSSSRRWCCRPSASRTYTFPSTGGSRVRTGTWPGISCPRLPPSLPTDPWRSYWPGTSGTAPTRASPNCPMTTSNPTRASCPSRVTSRPALVISSSSRRTANTLTVL